MKYSTTLLAIAVFSATLFLGSSTPAVAGTAVIEGTVTFPPAKPAPRLTKRYSGKSGAAKPEKKEAAPVAMIYLEGTFSADAMTPPEVPAVMEQRGLAFNPLVLPIVVGTTVTFPNFDDTYHNVFSYSPVKRFDLGRYLNEEKIPVETFEKAGTVKIFCEIHNHMRAVILVLETPHFTVTGEGGAFRLEGLPAGDYVLKAWFDERLVLEKPVKLTDGETATVDFDGKKKK